ncbi:hypothetical protein E5163_14325 [Marinicauda algicola]|uniref:Uncharacterized protein n=1 Tax=Marinicauda algicola TaxID=2029849 RepID=A0A4V3RXR9_9PROT|nr:hypothetical protein [Marinicauda algicola]TGY87609.1 hypothetical protein E5163_14325 [Marinicauda algicola]
MKPMKAIFGACLAIGLGAAGASAQAQGRNECAIRSIDRGHHAEAIAIYSGRTPGYYDFRYSQQIYDSSTEVDQAGPVPAAVRGPVEISRIRMAKSPDVRLTRFVPARGYGTSPSRGFNRPSVEALDRGDPILVATLSVRDASGRLICQTTHVDHTYRTGAGQARGYGQAGAGGSAIRRW